MSSVHLLASPADRLILTINCPQLTPAQTFDCFTVPDLLALWWSPQAELEPHLSGSYHLFWAGQNWHLRGTYREFVRGERLAFSWQWDHEADVPVRSVEIAFMPQDSGTQLKLTHGFYTPDDAEEKQGHLDGWRYFLPLLSVLELSRE
ncbi:MAG: hypothetical protein GC204_00630 [Chloroflexi bacterium]|nr:hypothetical protein [Chloroflexota bacterium]